MLIIKDYEEKLYKKIRETPDEYEETGQISGSKIAQPALTAILTMLGIEKKFDDYTLAKFMRGHDVERMFIERAFDKPAEIGEGGCWDADDRHYEWQYIIPKGYRGSTCSIDLLEESEREIIVHEIKSVGKMKYDRVCGTGMRKNQMAEPDLSHCLQVTLYTLSLKRDYNDKRIRTMIHYVNADDYRVSTFEIDINQYKAELDERIDAIYTAFASHRLPAYIPYEAWQKGKYNSFSELEKLSEDDVNSYIERQYPQAYQKFINANVGESGVEYVAS